MRQIIYVAQYLLIISYLCHMTILPKCAGQIHSTPVKNIFFLFLSFMQTCRLDIFAVLKHLHFPKYPNWCVKNPIQFPLKF